MMNDILNILAISFGGGLILGIVVFVRKRPHFEKLKYKNAKKLNYSSSLQNFKEDSFKRKIYISSIVDVLEIKPGVFWCEFLRSISGGGKGGGTKQIDAIYIKDNNFNCYRYISRDLVSLTMRYMDERGTLSMPANIIVFLNKYNVSIDSGDWGLLLMKNNGYFKGAEVEEILKDIEEVKYLTKKLKSN